MTSEYSTSVIKTEFFENDYAVLTVSRPAEFQFLAGQYTTFRFQDEQGVFERCYSIASAPLEENYLQFCIQIASKDFRSVSCIRNLKSGDLLVLTPAQGRFKIEDISKNLVFIAGGSGISPIRSLIDDLLASHKIDNPCTLIYGCRSASAIPFAKEFLELSQNHPTWFRLILTADQGTAPFVESGTVLQPIKSLFNSFHSDSHYYLCGPPAMMEAVLKCLKQFQIQDSQLFYEIYSVSTLKLSK